MLQESDHKTFTPIRAYHPPNLNSVQAIPNLHPSRTVLGCFGARHLDADVRTSSIVLLPGNELRSSHGNLPRKCNELYDLIQFNSSMDEVVVSMSYMKPMPLSSERLVLWCVRMRLQRLGPDEIIFGDSPDGNCSEWTVQTLYFQTHRFAIVWFLFVYSPSQVRTGLHLHGNRSKINQVWMSRPSKQESVRDRPGNENCGSSAGDGRRRVACKSLHSHTCLHVLSADPKTKKAHTN